MSERELAQLIMDFISYKNITEEFKKYCVNKNINISDLEEIIDKLQDE